jgi:hypothetical protein
MPRLKYDRPPRVKVKKREDRGGIFFYRFTFLGEPFNRSSGVKNRAEAQAIGDAHALDLWTKWKTGAKPVALDTTKGPVLSQEIDQFIREEYSEAAESTLIEVRRTLGYLVTYGKVGYVRELTRELMGEVYDVVRTQHAKAAATRRNTLNIWNKFFEYEIDESEKTGEIHLTANPIRKIKRPKSKDLGRRVDMWPDEMYETFLHGAIEAKDFELAEATRITRWTGLDPLDYAMLQSRHLVEDLAGVLEIRKLRAKAKFDTEFIKQPIDHAVSKLFHARKRKAGNNPDFLIFTSHAGIWHADPKEFKRRAKNWAAALTNRRLRLFRKLFPDYPRMLDFKHLRHTYATYMAVYGGPDGKGVPERVLREWMGHSETSRILEKVYFHIKTTSQHVRKPSEVKEMEEFELAA